MTRKQKLLSSAVIVGVLGTFAALGVFGLFSATTQNAGNEISTGTVALTDNDAGSALISVAGAKPGDSWTRCWRVTYNGSLPADIHRYVTGGGGPLAPYLHLTLEQGTQPAATFPGCTGFTPDATNGNGQVYDGPAIGGPNVSFETGDAISPFGQTVWNTGDSLVMRSTTTLSASAPDLVQGSSSGTYSIFFEARNDS